MCICSNLCSTVLCHSNNHVCNIHASVCIGAYPCKYKYESKFWFKILYMYVKCYSVINAIQ